MFVVAIFFYYNARLYLFQDEFAGDGVDLYDDVIAAPAGGNGGVSSGNTGESGGDTTSPNEETNGNAPYHQLGNNIQPNQIGRRHQLYVGNLTWVYIHVHRINSNISKDPSFPATFDGAFNM